MGESISDGSTEYSDSDIGAWMTGFWVKSLLQLESRRANTLKEKMYFIESVREYILLQ